MGVINHYKGLESERVIYNFNGKLKDNIDIDWDHAKIYKAAEELDSEYEVKEEDILIVYEYPGMSVATIVLLSITLAVGLGAGIYSGIQAKKYRKEMEDALKRIGKDNKQKEISPIPQMGDARNDRALGKNVPVILGKHFFAPYYLSDPYMKPSGVEGEDLYWYGTFLCGQNGLCFDKIRNGTIDLATFTDDTPQRRKLPFNAVDESSPFYSNENYIEIVQKGNEDSLNDFSESVFNEKWVDTIDSSVEIGRKESTIVVPANSTARSIYEAIGMNGTFNITGTYGSLEINQIRITGGSNNIGSLYPVVYIRSTDGKEEVIANSILNIPLRYELKITFNKSDKSMPDPILRETAQFPMNAEIEIFLNGLHAWDSENGKPVKTSVDIKLEYFNNKLDRWVRINIDGWDNTTEYSRLTKNSTRQMRFIAYADFKDAYEKDGNPIQIRATRLTENKTGSVRDTVYLNAIRTRQYNPEKSSTGNLVAAKNIKDELKEKFCLMGIKIKANLNTHEVLDRFNIIASMTGRVWDGAKWSEKKVKTNNPSAVLLELITGLIHPLSRHGDSEIHFKSFENLYEYCQNMNTDIHGKREVLIEGEALPTQFNLECNGVLTSGTRKIDAITQILATCDGGLYINENGKIEVFYDHKQETPIALLNPQRIVSMVDQRSLERKPDGYEIEYIDENAEWNSTKHRILRPNQPIPEAGTYSYSPIKLDFTTTYNQAAWHTRRIMAKEIHRKGVMPLTVGKEGLFYKPGSLIKVQNERFKIGLGSGEITELIIDNNQVIGLKLMERFDISKDRDYWVEYYVVDENRNEVVTKRIDTSKYKEGGEYTDRLYFTTPISLNSSDVPVFGNILSTMFGNDKTPDGAETPPLTIYQAKRYIVADLSENDDGYDLTLIPYSDDIYTTTTVKNIPPYQSSILNSPPRIYADRVRQDEAMMVADRVLGIEDVDSISREVAEAVVPQIVPEFTPRYRGAFERPGRVENGEGWIDEYRMNIGDYVMYYGETLTVEPYWEKSKMYQWNETWKKLDAIDNADKYILAFPDLLKLAPDAEFNEVFCMLLIAQDAFIKNLSAQNIVLSKMVDLNGIERSGVIQSKEFYPPGDPNAHGFKLSYDGLLQAVNALFESIRITGDSHFEGDIISGLMTSSSTPVGEDTPNRIFSPSNTVKNVFDHFGIPFVDNQSDVKNRVINGSWVSGDIARSIQTLLFSSRYYGVGQSMYRRFILTLVHEDDSRTTLFWTDGYDERTLGGTLTIDGSKRGPVFRLSNLRSVTAGTNPDGLLTDMVYRDSAGYLKIV